MSFVCVLSPQRLILGGGGLFAAFPKAYAALMPAVYMPIGFMLIALIFRGVAFEFRFKASDKSRRIWDYSFHYGSLVATFCQGIVLGTFVQGIDVDPWPLIPKSPYRSNPAPTAIGRPSGCPWCWSWLDRYRPTGNALFGAFSSKPTRMSNWWW